MFAKPKQGSGSRGAKLCYKGSDIRTLDKEKSIHRSSEYIFQEFLPGREYTVDVFCGLDSIPYNVVIRERLQVKNYLTEARWYCITMILITTI